MKNMLYIRAKLKTFFYCAKFAIYLTMYARRMGA